MSDLPEKLFINPGYICYSKDPVLMCSVVGSGVVVTLYDYVTKTGGMSYFVRPLLSSSDLPTPYFAEPSILGLIKSCKKEIGSLSRIEAYIYGGSEKSSADGYIKNLAEENINAAKKILLSKNISLVGIDTGGHRGRKIVFNTLTGETMVAKVDSVRNDDWYPKLITKKKRGL